MVERSSTIISYKHRLTIVFDDPICGSLNDRFQRSLHTVVKNSLTVIPVYGRWTIVVKNPFFLSYNDRFQGSLFTFVAWSFSVIPFCDRSTIFFNEPFLRLLNDHFNDLICLPWNDRVQRLLLETIERSFPATHFDDRWTDRFQRS